MKKGASFIVIVLLFITSISYAESIGWNYDKWGESGVFPEGWGAWNASFVSNGIDKDGKSSATAKVGDIDVWGKVYFLTGIPSSDIIGKFKYLYINTLAIQGKIKVALSGGNDADFYVVTPFLVGGDAKNTDEDKERILAPGPFVFDISGWKPSVNHPNVAIQIICEDGKGSSFQISRIFISDSNPMANDKK